MTIIQADILKWVETYAGPKFHALLCDPPYHLTEIAKRFGKPGAAPAQYGIDGAFARAGRGFMGKDWDGGDIAFRPATWQAIAEHLYPGAWGMAFAGSRGWHRMACAIEDAGLIIQPTIFGWAYGCLSDDSEILTANGWRRYDQIQEGNLVAAWDSAADTIMLQPIQEVISGPYQGDLIRFANDNTDQLLTPNHRVYHRARRRQMRDGKRPQWFNDEWEVAEAGAIPRWNHIKLPLASYHDGPGIGAGGADYAALLGWVWTEGGFDSQQGYTGVRITQSSVNPDKVETINAIVMRIAPDHKVYRRDREYQGRAYTEYTWYFSGDLARAVRLDLPDKHPTWDMLWRMTQEEKIAFFDAAMAGDGSGMAFYQKDPADREWFQTLVHIIGMQGRDNPRKLCVALHDNPTTELQGRHLRAVVTEPYSGVVWCVRVPTGAFVARRNGKIFLTGNSGFPKATHIGTQIDAQAFRAWLKLHPIEQTSLKAARDAERSARRAKDTAAIKETRAQLQALTMAYKASAGLLPSVLGQRKHQPKFAAAELGYREKDNGYNSRERETFDILDCATDAARYWIGHRYGGQALKPALEPIIVFQKPYDGSPLACITSTGAGALWIDGARIAGDTNNADPYLYQGDNGIAMGAASERLRTNGGGDRHEAGRWPANLILSHHPACNGTCAPGCPVTSMGAQSGETESKAADRGLINSGQMAGESGHLPNRDGISTVRGHDDTGTAARFFFQADYMAERIELADAIAYVAKASRSEREAGLDPRQTAIMRLLDDEDYQDFEAKVDGHAVYGDYQGTPEHASIPCSRRAQAFPDTTVDDGRETPIDNPYQRGETTRRNTHPTIKPISLTRYLATLLLPPAEYGPRRLLVPFAGAGSEVCGADLAGWEEVTGIELEADYVAIANARRVYWQQRRWELGDPARKLTVKAAPAIHAGQLDMFSEDV